MTSLKGLLKMAIKTTQELLDEISTIHTEAEIEEEVTKSVTDAVSAHIDETVTARVTALTETLTKQVADNQALIQAIADKLAAGDVNGANEAIAAAGTTTAVGETQETDAKATDTAGASA